MPIFSHQPEPSNVGEPQQVRDAYDNILAKQAATDALIREAIGEIEID